MPQKKQKPDNAGKNQAKRLPNGQFPPGVSGNPDGKPVGTKSFTTKVRDALSVLSKAKGEDGQPMSYEAALIKTVLKMAIVDERSEIVKLIWNYLDGMPVQPLGNPDGSNIGDVDAATKAKIDNIFNRNMRRPK